MLIPYNSNALMGGDNDVATSPFTLVFKNAGLAFAASFMNDKYGTPCLFVLPNEANANLSLLIEYNIRVDAY
jgi:hypothetical protein